MIKILNKIFGRKPHHPEDDFFVTVSDEFIQVSHPKKETQKVMWKDIEAIILINTNSGPAIDIWLNLLGKNSGASIPHGTKGFEEVYEIISKYKNFNFQNFIESMTCTENKEFLLWEKSTPKRF